MRCITVQQPWAWAIIHGGKNIENRTQLGMWRRAVGTTIAVHAGAQISEHGMADERIGHALRDRGHIHMPPAAFSPPGLNSLLGAPIHRSAILGVVDVDDVHPAAGCCEPWGEHDYWDADGDYRPDVVHLVLTNPQALTVPVPCRGKLGLWSLPEDIDAQVRSDLAAHGVSA
jgi:hypothetical protein